MILWIVAAVITAVLVAGVIRPIARPAREKPVDRSDHDIEVYRAQFAELDRDRARGVLEAEEAEATRREIARRLLAADRRRVHGSDAPGQDPASAPNPRSGRRLALTLAAVVPVVTLAGYLAAGTPSLPSQPFALRDQTEQRAQLAQVAAAEALAQALAEDPGDLPGWIELGRRWTALGRYVDASDAYARAVGLSEGHPTVVSAYAVSLVDASDGIVTEPARAAFELVADRVPDDPRARFYLAMADAQAGDLQAAIDGWSALLADSPADAPWVAVTRDQITEAATTLGLDVAAVMPEPLPPAVPPEAPADDVVAMDVDPDQVAAITALDTDDQAAAIQGMVDSLAARLEDAPDDLPGWMRLASAYGVMGNTEGAAEAFGRAAALAPDDPAILRSYADALLRHHGADLPPAFLETIQALYALNPEDPRALWVLGNQAADTGETDRAIALLTRLADQIPADSPERALVTDRIEALTATDATTTN